MKYNIHFILVLFAALVIFNSCDDNVLFSEKKEITSDSWEIKDSVIVKAVINNTEEFCNVFIDIDINETFLTNNLWLFVSTESPSGNIENDTIMYYVADVMGKWFGNKKGSHIENKFMYKPNIKFPEKGEYTFVLKHGMREKDLPLAKSTGITIELAEISKTPKK